MGKVPRASFVAVTIGGSGTVGGCFGVAVVGTVGGFVSMMIGLLLMGWCRWFG